MTRSPEPDRKLGAPVRFEGVGKRYGASWAVRGFDLEIAAGEFVSLLGASGSGKTTSLMMLAGFETPSEGRITVDGRPIDATPPAKRDIGMVFQSYALFPHMTAAENVAFPLRMRGRSKAEQQAAVARMLDVVGLAHLADRLPGQLSGGQQQRIAVARALVFDPELVLMDEPLGALDKQLREQMQFEIKHIHEQLGVTVVYVTHDQSEALTMSDRIAVFNDGKIQQLAPPPDLYERPTNSFVAQFIGENNTLDATVAEREGDYVKVRYEDGSTSTALAVNCGGPGEKTRLSLRPERVSFANQGEWGVPGKVKELIYLGDHIRVRMEVLGNNDFVVKVPNSSAHATLKVGETANLAWAADDCRALDAA